MILNDKEIKELALAGMISDFNESQIREVDGNRVISHGTSSFGYDVKLADEIRAFTNIYGGIIDPLNFKPEEVLIDVPTEGKEFFILPPNSYVLGHTVEYFKVPQDVMIICVGKSTYARAGIFVNVTPIEPGFEGQITLEIGNATPCPAKVYLNQGICQFIFFKGNRPEVTYSDRGGKYMGQLGVTTPRA